MKTIKFRFWLGHTKKMTYPHELKDVGKIIPEFTDDIVPLIFTGKHDQEGKEIYVGDIFREQIEEDWGDNLSYYIVTYLTEWTMFAALSPEEWNSYNADGIRAIQMEDYWTFPLENAHEQLVIGNVFEHYHKIHAEIAPE